MRSLSSLFALLILTLMSTACGSSFSAGFSESSYGAGPDSGQGSDAGSNGEAGSSDVAGSPSSSDGGSSGSAVIHETSGSAGTLSPGGAGSSGGSSGIGGSVSAAGGDAVSGGAGVPSCLDVQTSDANCGACGYACVNGRHCAAGRCAPAWQPLSANGQPDLRTRHAAAAAKGKYVVLGGTPVLGGVGMSSAAAYDPATNAWSTLPSLNSARCAHQAVSAGDTILTFGGLSDCGDGTTTTPGLESFDGTGWSAVDAPGEPEHRYDFAAIWTGTALFVYGGGTNGQSAIASGGLFTPSSASWSEVSCSLGSTCARSGTFSVFREGGSIRVWGQGSNSPGFTYDLNGRYWSTWAVPPGSAGHMAGRYADDGRRIYFLKDVNIVSVYDRKTSSWLANDTAAMPSGFCTEAAAAWTGSELVAWSGSCGGGPVAVGGRYQPAAPN